MVMARWWECSWRSAHMGWFGGKHLASHTLTRHSRQGSSHGEKLAHTWSCGWIVSRNLSPGQNSVEKLNTSLVEARSTTKHVVLGIVLTKGASSLACLLVVVRRMSRRAQLQTSSCSDRLELRRVCSRWLFSVFPSSLGYCGGSLASLRGMDGIVVDCQNCERPDEGVARRACGRTCWRCSVESKMLS